MVTQLLYYVPEVAAFWQGCAFFFFLSVVLQNLYEQQQNCITCGRALQLLNNCKEVSSMVVIPSCW